MRKSPWSAWSEKRKIVLVVLFGKAWIFADQEAVIFRGIYFNVSIVIGCASMFAKKEIISKNQKGWSSVGFDKIIPDRIRGAAVFVPGLKETAGEVAK